MRRIDFSNLGGFPFSATRLNYMQQSFTEPLVSLAKLIGNNTIVCGVTVAGSNVSDGWIVYDNELLFFAGGPLSAGVVVQETAELTMAFEDATNHGIHFNKYATCGVPATFQFSDLKRINTLQQIWLTGDVKMLHVDMAYVAANFDGTGLGKNERLGWAVCNGQNGTIDMGDKLPLGYNWINIAGTTDAVKAAKGSSTILQENLPAVQIDVPILKSETSVGPSGSGYITTGNEGNEPIDGPILKTNNLGAGNSYYPDSIITLYIVKL